MSESIKCQNQTIPAYSGITINITSPTLNAAPMYGQGTPGNLNAVGINVLPENKPGREYSYVDSPYSRVTPNGYYSQAEISQQSKENKLSEKQKTDYIGQEDMYYAQNEQDRRYMSDTSSQFSHESSAKEKEIIKETTTERIISPEQNQNGATTQVQDSIDVQNQIPQGQQAYPAQYYINNYNNPNQDSQKTANNNAEDKQETDAQTGTVINQYFAQPEEHAQDKAGTSGITSPKNDDSADAYGTTATKTTTPEGVIPKTALQDDLSDMNTDKDVDTSKSQEIIEQIDAENEKEKELQKNGKKTKVVALTNEYIMSLENYLNNPNVDIRLMAAKDIITRLDEDKDRYDDAALNALLNKMLQDPAKLVRIAALSALSADLASGNDYTVQLLNQIQQNPNADQQDVLEAAQILLNRSASTEIRYIPVQNEQRTEE